MLSKLAPVYPRAPQVIAYCDDSRRARRAVLSDGAPARRDPAQGAAGRVADRARARCASCSSTRSSICTRSTTRPPGSATSASRRATSSARSRAGPSATPARRPTTSPAMTSVAAWLAAHKPADGAPALIHNDFKFDNVIFDPALDADHRRARLGDGDDRRPADGSRHLAVVLGARPTTPRCSSSRCSA